MKIFSRSCRLMAAISGVALFVAFSASAQTYVPTATSGNYNTSFTVTPTSSGNLLSTNSGMTLYTYDLDGRNRSACYDDCARNWRPFLGNSNSRPSGSLTLFQRSDGTVQWADSGRPLYTSVQDMGPGQSRGDGYNNVWHVVRSNSQTAYQTAAFQPTAQPSSIPYNASFRMTPIGNGNVLSTYGGMTLYTYDRDTLNQSNCYGDCARTWKPFLANATSRPGGSLTLINRSDGTKQWAQNGRPLYTFAQDVGPGDYRGDNFNNVWHVVRDGSRVIYQPTATTYQPEAAAFNSAFRVNTTSEGGVLATSRGMTLYTYDKDLRNQSQCYNDCAKTWPPYLGNSNSRPSGNLTLIERKDGSLQWADNGRPLYTFVKDTTVGEMQGAGNSHKNWQVVRDGYQISTSQPVYQAPAVQPAYQAATYQPTYQAATYQPTYQATTVPYNTAFQTIQTGSGDILSTSRGLTLYTYESDVRNQSNCYGECARYWKPYLGSVTTRTGGDLTLIARADGTNQWADNGQPLYTYFEDRSPGEMKGVTHSNWHVAR
jgi:predicted lipoprotein with Yx(FWY)xxD motif